MINNDLYEVIIENEKQIFEHRIQKHRIIPLTSYDIINLPNREWFYNLRKSNIWAVRVQNQDFISYTGYRFVIGFHPRRLHLGHISLLKIIKTIIETVDDPEFIFVVADFDGNQSPNCIISEFQRMLLKYGVMDKHNCTFIFDRDLSKIRLLADEICTHVKVDKILKMFGWDANVNIRCLYGVMLVIASFLFSNFSYIEYKPTFVIVDINQTPFIELTSIVAKKLHFTQPAYMFNRLLPSICNISKRMSIRSEASAVFLDESIEDVKSKFLKAYSGGRTLEREYNDPYRCSFFRLAELLYDYDTICDMQTICRQGVKCAECKNMHLDGMLSSYKEFLE